jgi:hypothetical protein
MIARFTPTAQHLAAAALKIAAANHYMVGFDEGSTADISFDDFTDAHTILVETENQDTKHQHAYERAFMVLDLLCFARHRTHL